VTVDLRDQAYPPLTDRITVDDLPARRWVECASCIEIFRLKGLQGEAEQWTREHHKRTSHERFRIVRQTNWRIVPTSEDPDGGYPTEPFPALHEPAD
jgi:hypothetical protein